MPTNGLADGLVPVGSSKSLIEEEDLIRSNSLLIPDRPNPPDALTSLS